MQIQTPNRTPPVHSNSIDSLTVDPIYRLQQQILKLQHEVRFLKACCGVMFDNEHRLASWVYHAHPNINGQLFTRLKPYQPYQISETYPFQPTHVYVCSS
jgi:hypothetical protein